MRFGKIAVCISGELRTAIEAYPVFKEFFANYRIDVFCHIWDKEITDEQKRQVIDLYNPVFIEFQRPLDYDVGSFGSMLYSIMRANDLKKKYELALNSRYWAVVKYRFDIIFPKGIHFNGLDLQPRALFYSKENKGLVHTDYQLHGISDVIFWGDSETMDLVSNTYIYYKKRSLPKSIFIMHGRHYDPHYSFLSPGTLIYRLAVDHNIHPICVPGLRDVLWRTDIKHLDPWEDYDKIKARYEKI